MPKCDFTLQYGYSPVNLLYIFRTPFPKTARRGLLLSLSIHAAQGQWTNFPLCLHQLLNLKDGLLRIKREKGQKSANH